MEVISSSRVTDEARGQAVAGRAAGPRFVWVVYPRRRVVVCRSPVEVRVLTEADELDGGEWLPGLRVRVAELFRT